MAETGFDTLIKKDATTDDTLNLIVRTAIDYSHHGFAQKCALLLCPAGTDKQTCLRNVFDYYCRNVKYILDDPGVEKVYTPARTISEGQGDCKKAATYIAAVLLATKRPDLIPVFKWVVYRSNDDYSHIYIIVPDGGNINDYTTLDPTNNCQFNKEVSYQSGTLYFINGKKMELRQMGAPSNQANRYNIPWNEQIHEGAAEMLVGLDDIDLIGASSANPTLTHKGTVPPEHAAIVAKLTSGNPKLATSLNKIPLVNQRGAFLELIKSNTNGLASHLALVLAKDPAAITPIWNTVGGDINNLKQMIITGAKIKPDMKGPEYIGDASYEGYTLYRNGNPVGLDGVTQHVLNQYLTVHQLPKDNAHDYGALNALAIPAGDWRPPLPVPGSIAPAKQKSGFLAAAAGILHVVASVANIVLPGSGAVINSIAGKADQANAVIEAANANPGNFVAALPSDHTGMNDTAKHYTATGGTSHGSFYSPVGFTFKCAILQIPFHNYHTLCILLSVATIAPLIIWGYKKLFA